MSHLTAGYKLLALCPGIQDAGAFLLGTVSPDAIACRPGCVRSDKSATHFCAGDESWGYYTNYDEWTDSTIRNVRGFARTVNRDFLFGYLSHVIMDIENSRYFWTPARLTGDQDHTNAYSNDCREIDSVLFSQLEDANGLWSVLKESNKHCLSGLSSIGDHSMLIGQMSSEMYHDRRPTPGYALSVLTMSKHLWFLDEAVRLSLKYRDVCYAP